MEFYLDSHNLLLRLLPKIETPERLEYKFEKLTDNITCMGISWDRRHLYVGSYDNHFHILENYETSS